MGGVEVRFRAEADTDGDTRYCRIVDGHGRRELRSSALTKYATQHKLSPMSDVAI